MFLDLSIYMFFIEERVMEKDAGRRKTGIWFLFVELNSEPDCLFPATSEGEMRSDHLELDSSQALAWLFFQFTYFLKYRHKQNTFPFSS